MPDSPVRIHKFLASHGFASRRAIEKLIAEGKVLVNGIPAVIGQQVSDQDSFVIEGKPVDLHTPKKVVIAFHKPKGVECTMKKLIGKKTLANISFGSERVFPVGRLDKNSRGLFLLTSSGALAFHISHPRFEHEKEYIVTVDKPLSPEIIMRMSSGIIIDGKKTKPCTVEKLEAKVFRIILHEGRNRQIRKMCEACGVQVLDLLRVRVENIHLGELPEGKWRFLSETEVKGLERN